MDDQLIEEVRPNACLYSVEDPNYKNLLYKEKDWATIAQRLNIDAMRSINRSYWLIVVLYMTFHEESIFEDEDIFNQALPPLPHTGLTAPGTKWCGPGNTAINYDDLGRSSEADSCCRAHDHCDEIMETHTSLHGLRNPDWFPRLKCSCEQAFINCLQEANSITANTLARVYFGTRSNCFAIGFPILQCKEYQQGTFQKRCIRYHVDRTKSKIWQFYDLPFYTLSSSASTKII